MPNLYVRTTALHDVCGRIDYISSPARQEHLLAVYDNTTELLDGQFWQVLADESQQAFELYGQKSRMIRDPKTGDMKEIALRCCQGRENVIQLSNALLDRMKPERIAKIIAWEYKKKLGLDVIVAVHYNAKENNLHAHVVFPERQLLQEPVIKIAERNLFFDAAGKRRYKKTEILDENKQLLPGCRIVKKGEIYEQRYFSAADPKYSFKRWTAELKTDVILPLRNGELRGDVDITEYDPSTGKLAQRRWPQGSPKEIIEDCNKYNRLVKEFNQLIDSNRISLEEALAVQFEINHMTEKTAGLEAWMIKFREREDNLRRAEAEEEKKWYIHKIWMRDAHNRYKVRRYDPLTGRQRSTTELVLLLALFVIENEFNKKNTAVPQPRIIYVKKDWKAQQMFDSVALARRENIANPIQLEERLKEVGADLSRAKAEVARLTGSMDKMAPIMQAIQDYDALHQKCEDILGMSDRSLEKLQLLAEETVDLERYKQAKATMYQTGVAAPEGRQAFLERYSVIDENLQRANKSCDELKEQYSRLKKLDYNLRMAEIERYCYDPEWLPEEAKEQMVQEPSAHSKDQENERQKKPWDAPTDPGDR